MKTIEISINKSAVIKAVSLNSNYLDAAKDDNANRISTLEYDDNILSGFWTDCCGEVCEKLKEFIAGSQISSSEFYLKLELSGAFDDNLAPSVETDIQDALTAGITSRWLGLRASEMADDWMNKASALLKRALSKLCHRKRPVRKGV